VGIKSECLVEYDAV